MGVCTIYPPPTPIFFHEFILMVFFTIHAYLKGSVSSNLCYFHPDSGGHDLNKLESKI